MSLKVNSRLVIFAVALLFGLIFSLPTFLNLDKGAKINLGLDLQGGLYMLLGVHTDEAIANRVKSVASGIDAFAEQNDILIDGLRFDETSVYFELLDDKAKGKIDDYIKKLNGIVSSESASRYLLTLSDAEAKLVRSSSVSQAVETIRNRLDQFGLSEPTVAKQGVDQILVELPGIKTAEDEQRARNLIAQAAHLQMMAVDEQNIARVSAMSEAEANALGSTILTDVYEPNVRYLLKRIPILDGERLSDARVGFDQQTNQAVIHFTLDGEGARVFGDFSGKNVGKRLAIVLDDKVYSAPVIRERIGGGSGQISGSFTTETASDLAIALRSGSLSASVDMQEKRSVGPSLGEESIKASAIALISGFLIVALFMIFYYRVAGLISVIALCVNLFMIVAIMAFFGATLTLPGMVGIVLTIGMAVDANVIINERVKELLFEGKSVLKAIEQGYANAFSAILDANITTLIAAVSLYAYGTGPIKGFAVTLSVGILCSMLTAIVGTRGIFDALSGNINSKNAKFYFSIPKGGREANV
ncbi:MAG: protein translocase subunit SecD [Helicobacteraceae bacterium]|jgi:preprotein translocase subunit SecD|nr:protein translocase subunit SecD [Helicobacteraceae bacterium]